MIKLKKYDMSNITNKKLKTKQKA